MSATRQLNQWYPILWRAGWKIADDLKRWVTDKYQGILRFFMLSSIQKFHSARPQWWDLHPNGLIGLPKNTERRGGWPTLYQHLALKMALKLTFLKHNAFKLKIQCHKKKNLSSILFVDFQMSSAAVFFLKKNTNLDVVVVFFSINISIFNLTSQAFNPQVKVYPWRRRGCRLQRGPVPVQSWCQLCGWCQGMPSLSGPLCQSKMMSGTGVFCPHIVGWLLNYICCWGDLASALWNRGRHSLIHSLSCW